MAVISDRAPDLAHPSHVVRQSKKAAASGWMDSALEYYDFFIYG